MDVASTTFTQDIVVVTPSSPSSSSSSSSLFLSSPSSSSSSSMSEPSLLSQISIATNIYYSDDVHQQHPGLREEPLRDVSGSWASDPTITDDETHFALYHSQQYLTSPLAPPHQDAQPQERQQRQVVLPPPPLDIDFCPSTSEHQILSPEELDTIFEFLAIAVNGGDAIDSCVNNICCLEDEEQLAKTLGAMTMI